jgi:hypothetical protein
MGGVMKGKRRIRVAVIFLALIAAVGIVWTHLQAHAGGGWYAAFLPLAVGFVFVCAEVGERA